MAQLSEAITIPAPSMADRSVPAASRGHCTGYAVLGSGAGVRVQAESWLEYCTLILLNDMLDVVAMTEQVEFLYGDDEDDPSKHYFDVVARLVCGRRIAFTIKPEVRLVSGRFLDEMAEIAWWAENLQFADEVRMLTEADLDPVALHNAQIMQAMREPDPEADDVVRGIVARMVGGRSVRDLTLETGLRARGYRAVLRAVRTRDLRPVLREKITPLSNLIPTRIAA